jgi:hypothetical protein
MTEEWFWDVTPRVLITMLDEKKKIDISNWKIFACLNNGGEITLGEEEIQGIDKPANVADMAFMGG